jgi:hypothetical protein
MALLDSREKGKYGLDFSHVFAASASTFCLGFD